MQVVWGSGFAHCYSSSVTQGLRPVSSQLMLLNEWEDAHLPGELMHTSVTTPFGRIPISEGRALLQSLLDILGQDRGCTSFYSTCGGLCGSQQC